METSPENVSFDPTGATPVEDSPDSTPATGGFDPTGAEPIDSGPPKITGHAARDMLYPGVDFDTGLPFADQIALAQSDNLKESLKYLNKVYGRNNVEAMWGPDGEPMLVVTTKEGKKFAAQGGSKLTHLAADVGGNFPMYGGMAAGASAGGQLGAAGGPLAPLTVPLGVVGGAALGGMAGKTVIEGEKALEGRYDKSADEYAEEQLKAGLGGAAGELTAGVGRGVAKGVMRAGSRVARGKLPEALTHTTPEIAEKTKRTIEQGAAPPVASTMPGAKRLQFRQARARKLGVESFAQDQANDEFVERGIKRALAKGGIPVSHLNAAFDELAQGQRISSTAAGQHVKRAVQAHRDMLRESADSALAGANRAMSEQLEHIDKLVSKYSSADLGVNAAQAIKSARADFGTSMSKVYGKIDQMVGGQPIVPTDILRRKAREIGSKLPRSSQAAVTKEMSQLPAGAPEEADVALFKELGIELPPSGKITLSDAQRIRTMLREKSDESSLTRGVTAGEMGALADAVDYSITAAARDPAAAPAIKLLRSTDRAYAEGIRKFNDATVKRLVKDMEAGLPPDPQTVAARIIQPGYEARVKQVRKLVGENVWRQVRAADFDRILGEARDSATGDVDGAKLLAEINARGSLIDEVYGQPFAGDLRDLARAFAARDGKIPIDALQPGKLFSTLQGFQRSEAIFDDFMKKNALSSLANDKKAPEAVYQWLVNPKNESALVEASKMLSPEQRGLLQQTALKQLLAGAKFKTADARPATALRDAILQFTPAQQKILFPNGLADDLKLLADDIAFVMPDVLDESMAGMSSGAIHGKTALKAYPTMIWNGMYSYLLGNPTVIRYLAVGLREPGEPNKVASEMIANLVRYGTVAPMMDSDDEHTAPDSKRNPGQLGTAAAGSGAAPVDPGVPARPGAPH